MAEQSERTLSPAVRWQQGGDDAWAENKALLGRIEPMIKEGQRAELRALIGQWPPADIKELLIQLPLKRAAKLHRWLPRKLAVKALVELSPDLRAALMARTRRKRLATIVRSLNDDDAVELLANLPEDRVEALLPELPRAAELRERLKFGEDTAGGIMSNRFVAVLEHWDVGTATRQIRRHAPDIEKFYEIYVVDDQQHLLGRLKVRDLLLHDAGVMIRDIMREVPASVGADADQEEVLELAQRFHLQTVPVLDAERRVIGRVTLDDLQDVIRREAEEDIKLMSGVDPDSQADESLWRMIRGRLPWLVGGLLGASLAATVVGSFEEELARAAILASFIPVVMAMAGNAGIQASTVTVQGLASGNLWFGDLGRRVAKELAGSLINGLAVAALMAALILGAAEIVPIASAAKLALAVGLSVAIVTVMASTLGATVPLLLHHFRIDPAVATGVFITTTNDVFGVLVYFLMATAIYANDPSLLL